MATAMCLKTSKVMQLLSFKLYTYGLLLLGYK